MGDPPATSRTRGGIITHNRGASWSQRSWGGQTGSQASHPPQPPQGRSQTSPGPGWEDLSSGTIASMAPRRRRWGRERRSEAPGALRSRPLVARGAHREGRAQPARSVTGPDATGRALAPEATARRDCCRRTGSPQGPIAPIRRPADCSRTGQVPGVPNALDCAKQLAHSGAEPAAGREFQVAWALIILCVEVVLGGAAARAAHEVRRRARPSVPSLGDVALRRWPAEAAAA